MSFSPLPGLPQDGDGDGTGQLVQLIYRSVSTRRVASALEMSDILAQARPRNAKLGVTGVLTVVNGEFVQIIEGPETSIDALIDSLTRDARHEKLRVMERRFVKNRTFGDWDMISPRLVGLEAAQLALLLAVDADEIDQFLPVMHEAIRRQTAVLDGDEVIDAFKPQRDEVAPKSVQAKPEA